MSIISAAENGVELELTDEEKANSSLNTPSAFKEALKKKKEGKTSSTKKPNTFAEMRKLLTNKQKKK